MQLAVRSWQLDFKRLFCELRTASCRLLLLSGRNDAAAAVLIQMAHGFLPVFLVRVPGIPVRRLQAFVAVGKGAPAQDF